MPTGLVEFRLPSHIAERKARESLPELDMDLSCSINTQNSSVSELPSPVTPTFSTRGHMRHPSSASSIESQYLYESPSSPIFTSNKSGKRSLPDVQEEPRSERENDFMFEEYDDDVPDCDELYNCLCDDLYCLHRDTSSTVQSSVQLSTNQDLDYDLSDGFFSDGEFSSLNSRYKKRRGNESPLNGLTSRFGTKFPSFARKWSSRKGTGSSAASISSDTQRDYANSRAPSSRSSSRSNSGRRHLDDSSDLHLPPTPTGSVFGGRDNSSTTSFLDIEKAKSSTSEFEEGLAGTPLLPPLMSDASINAQFKMQSPLQSPSVADASDPLFGTSAPMDFITTYQLPGMPSPPLSTKPSISSFHRSTIRSNYIAPSEIPAILIAEENDEWANKLGHANFVIHPEPYVPENFDLEACRQLRADWDLARCNYTKHVVRTGEHYGVTSKTYKLTEEKWAQIDLKWMKNNELTIATTAQSSTDAFATLKHNTLGNGSSSNVMTKIPSLNDPRSEGKFPQLGDEDIVGPMVQAAAQLRRNPSKKAKLFRFLTEKFPVGLGKP
ncbi:hypothetical protein SBOR_2541 [Sclerotinia borealis F-4128]|uniref:Only prolin and serin are matching in the corresponding protein n=1 Tax=Sclerotinia borealis (strain F-4128) TaxID=1432307 RepID=W9CMN9_SCLBF|nr:hypothetical protein SBOR_2541 [Sclerotinia borealis F-4128]